MERNEFLTQVCVFVRGALLFPADLFSEKSKTVIEEKISRIPFLVSSANSFMVQMSEECLTYKNLRLYFELKENPSFIEMALVHREITKQIIGELKTIKQDFWENLKMPALQDEPKIEFYPMKDGPFKAIG